MEISEKTCVRKKYIWNPGTSTCENGKYLGGSIIVDSVNACAEIIEVTRTVPAKSVPTKTVPLKNTPAKTTPTKTVPKNFFKKTVACKIENFDIFLTFFLIAISLLIIVSYYCCFIKHRSKLEYLLPYYDISNQLKEIDINNIIDK